jgi:hypothetical protein
MTQYAGYQLPFVGIKMKGASASLDIGLCPLDGDGLHVGLRAQIERSTEQG